MYIGFASIMDWTTAKTAYQMKVAKYTITIELIIEAQKCFYQFTHSNDSCECNVYEFLTV